MGAAPAIGNKKQQGAAERPRPVLLYGGGTGQPCVGTDDEEENEMARCVIVSAGSAVPADKAFLKPGDTVIACDAGYRNCALLGLRPEIILGDFDSAPRPNWSNVVVLPHVKDDTDTHYAARLAAERGFQEVLMLGALGGRRLEHTLANLSTGLWLTKQGINVTIADASSRITYVRPGPIRRYPRGDYQYFSVFPAEGAASGVCIRGAFYPLEDAALTADFPLGVSNEFAAEEIAITSRTGILLVIETRADQ